MAMDARSAPSRLLAACLLLPLLWRCRGPAARATPEAQALFVRARGNRLERPTPPEPDWVISRSSDEIGALAGYALYLPSVEGREVRFPERIWGYGDVTPFGLFELVYDAAHDDVFAVYTSGQWHPRAGTMVCRRDEVRVLDHNWLTPIHYRCDDCCLTLVVRQARLPDPPGALPSCWVGAGAVVEAVQVGEASGALVRGRWAIEGTSQEGSQSLRWSGDEAYATLRWTTCGWLFEIRARGEDYGFSLDELPLIAADIARQVDCN
jgi:hypothetical protein